MKRLKSFYKLILVISLIFLLLFSPVIKANLPVVISAISEASKVIIATASIIISGLLNKNKLPDFKKEIAKSDFKEKETVDFKDEHSEINVNRIIAEKASQMIRPRIVKFNSTELEEVLKNRFVNLEKNEGAVEKILPRLIVADGGEGESFSLSQDSYSLLYYNLSNDLQKIVTTYNFPTSQVLSPKVPLRWGSDAGPVRQISANQALYPICSSPSGRFLSGVSVRTSGMESRKRVRDLTPSCLPVRQGYGHHRFKHMTASEFANYYNVHGAMTVFDQPGGIGWYGNVIMQLHMWQYSSFRDYIRDLSQYKPIIFTLAEKRSDSSFAEMLDEVPGFKVKRHSWIPGVGNHKDVHEFQRYICQEFDRLCEEERSREAQRQTSERVERERRIAKESREINEKKVARKVWYERQAGIVQCKGDFIETESMNDLVAKIHKTFREFKMDPFYMNFCKSNSDYRKMQDRTMQVLSEAIDLDKVYGDSVCIGNMSKIIFKMGQRSLENLRRENLNRKIALGDFCQKLFEVNRQIAFIIYNTADESKELSAEAIRELFVAYDDAAKIFGEYLVLSCKDLEKYNENVLSPEKTIAQNVLMAELHKCINFVSQQIFDFRKEDGPSLLSVIDTEANYSAENNQTKDLTIKGLLCPIQEIFVKGAQLAQEAVEKEILRQETLEEFLKSYKVSETKRQALKDQRHQEQENEQELLESSKIREEFLRYQNFPSLLKKLIYKYKIPEIVEIETCARDSFSNQSLIELSMLEKTYSNLAIKSLVFEDSTFYKDFKNKKVAVSQTLAKPEKLSNQTYELDDFTKTFLNEHNISVEKFSYFEGNLLQQKLLQEMVLTLHTTSALTYAYSDNFHIRNISSVIYRLLDAAYEASKDQRYLEVDSLLNLSDTLLKLEGNFIEFVDSGVDVSLDAISKGIGFVEKEIKNETEENGESIVKIIDKFNEDIFDRPCFQKISNNIGYKIPLYLADQAIFRLECCNDFLTKIKDVSQDNSDLIGLLVRIISFGRTFESPSENKQLQALISEIERITFFESQISSLVVVETKIDNQNLKLALCPIKTIFEGASQIVKVAIDNDVDTAKEILRWLQEEPEIVKVHGSVGNAIKRLRGYVGAFREYLKEVEEFYGKISKNRQRAKNDRSSTKRYVYNLNTSNNEPPFHDPKKPKKEKDKRSGIKGLIKDKQLPTKGKIRYIPPEEVKTIKGLPRIKLADGRIGFRDKFGNVWTKGDSRTFGEGREWDVQLSNQGKQQLGWASRSGKHLNVSLKGRITH